MNCELLVTLENMDLAFSFMLFWSLPGGDWEKAYNLVKILRLLSRFGLENSRCKWGTKLAVYWLTTDDMFKIGAGTGGLGLAIEGPSEAKMTCKDNRDGSCSVEYIPTEPGDYDVSIKFADQHIPGSPFKVW